MHVIEVKSQSVKLPAPSFYCIVDRGRAAFRRLHFTELKNSLEENGLYPPSHPGMEDAWMGPEYREKMFECGVGGEIEVLKKTARKRRVKQIRGR